MRRKREGDEVKRKQVEAMEQKEQGIRGERGAISGRAGRLKRSVKAKVALPRPFRHVLQSDQNQIVNRNVTRADLPPGVFLRVHRSP